MVAVLNRTSKMNDALNRTDLLGVGPIDRCAFDFVATDQRTCFTPFRFHRRLLLETLNCDREAIVPTF